MKLRVRALESERAFQRVAAVQKTVGSVSKTFSHLLHLDPFFQKKFGKVNHMRSNSKTRIFLRNFESISRVLFYVLKLVSFPVFSNPMRLPTGCCCGKFSQSRNDFVSEFLKSKLLVIKPNLFFSSFS